MVSKAHLQVLKGQANEYYQELFDDVQRSSEEDNRQTWMFLQSDMALIDLIPHIDEHL